MNCLKKLVMYYILDYTGILFILDINSVLGEFIFVGLETFEEIV